MYLKYFYLTMSIVFVSFGILQYNDPDPYIWSPFYLVIAWLCFQAYREIYNHTLTLVTLIGTMVWAFSYLPKVVIWVKEGLPNIVGGMKAETPYIENMREFLGLIMSALMLSYIVFKHHKRK